MNRPKKKDKVYINPYSNIVHCGCCNKVMRYTYSNSMNQFFYVCSKCKTRIYLQDLETFLKEDILKQIFTIQNKDIKQYKQSQISKLKEKVKKVDLAIRKEFEFYAKNQISESTFQDNMKELLLKKEQIFLKISNQEESITHFLECYLEDVKIDNALINKLVKEVTVKTTGKRKYDVHINYNFKYHN